MSDSPQTETHTSFGRSYRVVVPASIGYPQHSTATFEDHEPCFLKYWGKVRMGDVVIDAGPFFGSYTMPALAAGAHVIAFEPFDEAREILRASVAANGWQSGFRLVPHALWDGQTNYPAELARSVWTDHYPSSSPLTHMALDELRTEDEDSSRLITRIDWIKSDVEGAELGLLLGALNTLHRWHPSLIIEDHDGIDPNPACVVSSYPASIQSARRIHGLLDALGYEVEVMRWDVSRKFICAVHPSRPEHKP